MSLKSERLAKTIQDIQQIAADHIPHDGRFQAIAQTLDDTLKTLQGGKLSLHLVSQSLDIPLALREILVSSSSLAEQYHIGVMPIPEVETITPQLTATLVFQDLSQSLHTYILSSNRPSVLGRRPGCSVLIPDSYGLVSGQHASVEFIHSSDDDHLDAARAPEGWYIHDSSRNGTYVNGELVQGHQRLDVGDRITLGAPYPSDSCPLLLFDTSSTSVIHHSQLAAVLDCDVMGMLISATQPLTALEQEWLTTMGRASISRKFVLVTQPSSEQATNWTSANLIEAIAQFNQTTEQSPIEVLPITVQFSGSATVHHSEVHPDVHAFLNILEIMVKRRPEDILSKRLALQTQANVSAIEYLLTLQEKLIATENRPIPQVSQEIPIGLVQEQVNRAFKAIHDNKSVFFKQAKERLKAAKGNLLDEYLESSILNQIRQFIQQLKPDVVKKGNRKFIQLKYRMSTAAEASPDPSTSPQSASETPLSGTSDKTVDANTAIMQFCQSRLGLWVTAEWHYFCTEHHQGGIHGLVQYLFETFQSIDYLNLSRCKYSSFQPRVAIAYHSIFDENFTKPVDEIPYQEPSPVSYILKRIRSQWMQFIFLFSFFSILGIAGRRQIMRHITAPIGAAFQTHPWIATGVLLVILFFAVKGLIRIYQDDRDAAREKEAKKIRDTLCSYYQSLVKNRLAERLIQVIVTELDTEEHSIDHMIEALKHSIQQAIADSESRLPVGHPQINGNTINLRDLERDQAKLRKLKGMIRL